MKTYSSLLQHQSSLKKDQQYIDSRRQLLARQKEEYLHHLSYAAFSQDSLKHRQQFFYDSRYDIFTQLQHSLKDQLKINVRGEDEADFKYRDGQPILPRPCKLTQNNTSLTLALSNNYLLSQNSVPLVPFESSNLLGPKADIDKNYVLYVDFDNAPLRYNLRLSELEIYMGETPLEAVGLAVLQPLAQENTFKVRSFKYLSQIEFPFLFNKTSDSTNASLTIPGLLPVSTQKKQSEKTVLNPLFTLDFTAVGPIVARKGDRWGIVLTKEKTIPCNYTPDIGSGKFGDVRMVPFDLDDAEVGGKTAVYDFTNHLQYRATPPYNQQAKGVRGLDEVQTSENYEDPVLKAAISFGVYGTIVKH